VPAIGIRLVDIHGLGPEIELETREQRVDIVDVSYLIRACAQDAPGHGHRPTGGIDSRVKVGVAVHQKTPRTVIREQGPIRRIQGFVQHFEERALLGLRRAQDIPTHNHRTVTIGLWRSAELGQRQRTVGLQAELLRDGIVDTAALQSDNETDHTRKIRHLPP
jgi:hypothetical protein